MKKMFTTQIEKNQLNKNNTSQKRVPIEKKLRMAQYIREENMDNRMKIRQREKLLYGTDSPLPLWDKNNTFQRETYLRTGTDAENSMDNAPADAMDTVTGTFKLRMALAIALFIGFLLCDAGQYKVFGYSMNDLYGMISEDYFQIYDTNQEQNRIQLTELFKF